MPGVIDGITALLSVLLNIAERGRQKTGSMINA